jgi:hypothetical protein
VQTQTRVNNFLQFRREITHIADECHKFLIGWGSGGLRFTSVISAKLRPFAGNHPHRENGKDPTAYDGEWNAEKLSNHPCFQLTELWPSLEKYLVDTGHTPAKMVWRL